MEEHEIIKRVKNGEIEHFSHIVEKYHRPLLKFIYTLTRNSSLTEDIGQMVFVSFFKNLDSFDENRDRPVSAWLFVTARNMTINTLRKESPFAYTGDPEEFGQVSTANDPEETLIKKSDRELLNDCLNTLEEPYRSTLIESLNGSSLKEIAAKEQILPGTAKSRLHRAKAKCIALFRDKLSRGSYV